MVESARRIMQDAKSSSSSNRSGSPSSSGQDWCPVLPAARDVLPAVLVHTRGMRKAVEWLQQQQQPPSNSMQPLQTSSKSKKRGAAAAVTSTGATLDSDKRRQLSIEEVNGFLHAALEVAQGSGNNSVAAAIAKEAVQAANELFNYPLAAAQLPKSGAGGSSSSSSFSSGSLLPNATSYCLLLSLHGAAGEFQSVSDLVMAAVRGQLPLGGQQQQQQHEVWSPPAVEVLLSAAADVWLAAGAPDLAVSLLDGLLVAGGRDITQPTLAAAMLEAAGKGDEEEQVRVGHMTATCR